MNAKRVARTRRAEPEEIGGRGHCEVPMVPTPVFSPGFDPERAAAILVSSDKWVNGTELRYHFLDEPTTAGDKKAVRDAFKQWQTLPIGISFREVADPNEAEVRITFDRTDGSWSYLGRQVLDRPQAEATMNFGWRLSGPGGDPDTALHEIGHTLGLPHEHQNPNAGIVWDEPKVISRFAGPPNNWPEQKTRWNILRKIPRDSVEGSEWDRDSVMHYAFPAGLILQPAEFQDVPLEPAGGLSSRDVDWIKRFYPPQAVEGPPSLNPFDSQSLNLAAGEQLDYTVVPPATREYTFQTFGAADTVLVLFEDVTTGPAEGRGLRYRVGDDDSATDRNATFRVKLFKGKRYVVRVRLYWSWATGESALMYW